MQPISSVVWGGFSGHHWRCGAATCLNQRAQNEDRFVVVSLSRHPGWSMFALADGHGGDLVAEYTVQHLATHLNQVEEIRPDHITAALQSLDREILELKDFSGATLALVLLRADDQQRLQGWAAHLGDSRIIHANRLGQVLWSSEDHSPARPDERARIEAAGGFVNDDDRINGVLNLSRALGDAIFKAAPDLPPASQLVSSIPDITPLMVGPGEHIILCSDGLLEPELSDNSSLARSAAMPFEPEGKARAMVQLALPTSVDNLTVLLISAGVGGVPRPLEWVAGPFYPWATDLAFRHRYLKDAARFGVTGLDVFRQALDSSMVWLKKQTLPVGLPLGELERLIHEDRLRFYELYLQDQAAFKAPLDDINLDFQ